MSKFLSRDEILAADDRRYEIVAVPEWGGDVRLRSLTAGERDDFEQGALRGKGDNISINRRNIRAKLVALCAVDEGGSPLFSKADVISLSNKNAKPLNRLFEAAQRLCGITDEDAEELAEGFGETQDALSVSD